MFWEASRTILEASRPVAGSSYQQCQGTENSSVGLYEAKAFALPRALWVQVLCQIPGRFLQLWPLAEFIKTALAI